MLDDTRQYGSWRSEGKTRLCEDMAARVENLNLTINRKLNGYQMILELEEKLLSEFKCDKNEMDEFNRKVSMLKYAVDNMKKPATEDSKNEICVGFIFDDDPRDALTIAKETAKAIKVQFDETKITSSSSSGSVDVKVTTSLCLKFSDPKLCQEWLRKCTQVFGLSPKETVKFINYDLLKKQVVVHV